MWKVMITLKTEVVHVLIGRDMSRVLMVIFDGFSVVFTFNVLHFIWNSHVKCLSRIGFEVVSRNLNSSSEIQVVHPNR